MYTILLLFIEVGFITLLIFNSRQQIFVNKLEGIPEEVENQCRLLSPIFPDSSILTEVKSAFEIGPRKPCLLFSTNKSVNK